MFHFAYISQKRKTSSPNFLIRQHIQILSYTIYKKTKQLKCSELTRYFKIKDNLDL